MGHSRADRRAWASDARRAARSGNWGPWVSKPEVVRLMRSASGPLRWMVEAWVSTLYSVQIHERPADLWDGRPVLWLAIRRQDNGASFPWTDLQRIKDELIGVRRVAMQVHPAASEVVDVANMAHLWVLPAGVELSFGFRGEGGRG